MTSLLAIARLTLKAAFRYRLVQVLALALLGAVVLLPLAIKDDGTARGFTQILLTYTLSAITAFLGLATLWMACGTLARDVEECQIQMVAVKPVARWQIWLGKWIGIMAVNGLLLATASLAVFILLQYRAGKLPAAQQEALRREILVARAGIKEEIPDLEPTIARVFQEILKQNTIAPADRPQALRQVSERVKYQYQLVQPAYRRIWKIPLGWRKDALRDQPLFLRVKFSSSLPPESTLTGPPTFQTLWQIGDPGKTRVARQARSLAADTFHEMPIPANLYDADGVLTVEFTNPTETAVVFQLEDGLEVLFREGGFGLNFARGMGVIYCWLALLAALGLAAASFLSFPVAAFLAFGLLIVGFSTGTLSQVVEEGGIAGINHETGVVDNPDLLDRVAVPMAKAMLGVINLARGYSPIDALSSGRSIAWSQLAMAVVEIVGILGGIFAAIGIVTFTRRELATAQFNQ
jgi:hypothetical protein